MSDFFICSFELILLWNLWVIWDSCELNNVGWQVQLHSNIKPAGKRERRCRYLKIGYRPPNQMSFWGDDTNALLWLFMVWTRLLELMDGGLDLTSTTRRTQRIELVAAEPKRNVTNSPFQFFWVCQQFGNFGWGVIKGFSTNNMARRREI